MRTLIRARTRDVNALRRARDAAGTQRIKIAEYSAETCEVGEEDGKIVIYALTAMADLGTVTNGVTAGPPSEAVRAQERQSTGDARKYRDARRAYDAQTGLIAKMNQKAKDFWANGGKR